LSYNYGDITLALKLHAQLLSSVANSI